MSNEKIKHVKMSCTTCPNSCELVATIEDNKVTAVTGNLCKRGIAFAEKEWLAPERMLTTTMILRRAGQPDVSIPVKSKTPMLRDKMFDVMAVIRKTPVDHPVKMGDVLIPNAADCDVDIVAAKTVE